MKQFAKENPFVMFIMLALAITFIIPDSLMAGGAIETMKTIYVNQAQNNAFPAVILWIIVLGVALSFKMNSFMPFILAVIASAVIGVSPDIVGQFNFSDLNSTN